MKKTLLAILLGVTINASAVTFQWGSNGQVSFGDSLVSALTPATYTATVLYLGTDAAWTDVTITESGLSYDEQSVGTGTSITGKAGAFASRNSTVSGTSKAGVAGGSYGLLLSYVDSDNKPWYNSSSTIYTIPADADESTTGLSSSFDFKSTKTQVASGGSVSAGSGWVAVPEPSTAMLALAGLALLIKRRRA